MKMGILSINKSNGMTSHDVVSILRKKLKIKKIGHTGTLDPMATGVLPICIGNATRVSEYIMNQGKSYVAEIKFGEETDTYDIEGKIINKSENKIFSSEQIENVLKKFIGKIEQLPPIYSAIKVNGKKLYEYARNNIDIEIKARKVEIYDIKLLDVKNEYAKILVKCSKGTYIRSLIHDIGLELSTYSHMTKLVRVQVGNFLLENSLDINNIENMSDSEIFDNMMNIEEALYNFDRINLSENHKFRILNGQRIKLTDIDIDKKDGEYLLFIENTFYGISSIKNKILKMEKLLVKNN